MTPALKKVSERLGKKYPFRIYQVRARKPGESDYRDHWWVTVSETVHFFLPGNGGLVTRMYGLRIMRMWHEEGKSREEITALTGCVDFK